MPVDLHERLSEFSYGYGVTREVERALRKAGLAATPFLPSLIHEATLGFDVSFARAGVPLMLQFKLGQAMRRFVPAPRPTLAQPFWRFRIDTAEPDGQYELLLKAERDGADVFYVAPKFHDWELYLEAFEKRRVLKSSLILRPGEVRRGLDTHSVADGEHKVVYDKWNTYLCSEPLELETVDAGDIVGKVRAHIEQRDASLGSTLERVFAGFSDRSSVRRPSVSRRSEDSERAVYAIPSDDGRQSGLRQDRLAGLIQRGRTREEAVAMSVGAEAWAAGAQLILVTEKE